MIQVPPSNTRISAGTKQQSMGGGVWEQTNLGGVKVWGDSCGGQATSGMCRRLRSTTVRWFPPTRPWIPVLGVYIFSPLLCLLLLGVLWGLCQGCFCFWPWCIAICRICVLFWRLLCWGCHGDWTLELLWSSGCAALVSWLSWSFFNWIGGGII